MRSDVLDFSGMNRHPNVPMGETFEDWLQLIRGEYLEMPGLRLTKQQVQRRTRHHAYVRC